MRSCAVLAICTILGSRIGLANNVSGNEVLWQAGFCGS